MSHCAFDDADEASSTPIALLSLLVVVVAAAVATSGKVKVMGKSSSFVQHSVQDDVAVVGS